ncbi:MAG: chromosome partitioning protein ParA, partial [Clostridiaceae bacterium]|nr:chromosome partitioning protein ParA [Clostridiaceae bacterium]
MRYLKKAEGAISIFLCIILISVILLSSLLVEGSRMKTAETQIQSALDNASKSALTCYNNLLKDMYGLMALSDDDPSKLMEEVYYYLERNLQTSGIEEHRTISEKTLDEINGSDTVNAIKDFLGVDSKGAKPPLDLYGFEIE